MTSVGEVFVRVRPDASGFQREATGPIVGAGNALGKAFLAAFAIGGSAKTIESVVKAATEHQAAFAVLDQTTKDAGAANDLYGQSLESLLEKEARLKGFTDEELASGFQRLVSVTHDSKQAFTDLGAAEDLARFRHIDLATAALAVSKAEQGSVTALQRYGIVVPQVTTAQDALTLARQRAVAEGAKFTEAQKEAYDQALVAAKAQDSQARSTEALALIQQRAGGAATVFAQTTAGQFARLQQDFHQFEVAVGTGLLSSLSSAAEGLGAFFTQAENSGRVRSDIDQLTGDIRSGLTDIKDVAETVGPPLLAVAGAAKDVVSAIGAPALLIAYGTFKALGIVQKELTAAEGLYARAIAAARSETVADTSAQGRQTAAIAANTEALNAQTAAATTTEGTYSASLATATAAIEGQTAALEGLAAAFVTVGTTAAEAGVAAGTLRLGTGVQTGLTVVSGAEAAASDASAAATVALTSENNALAAALARVDAARATSIAAETEATVAINAEAAALARLVEADTAAAAAAVRTGLATQASAVYFGELATAATIAAAAEERAALAAATSGVAEFASGLGTLGLAAVGGPAGAAVLGLAAVAGGIYKLVTAENVATSATHGLISATAGLSDALHSDRVDNLALAQARLTLRQDQSALSASKAAHSSAEYQQLLLNVANDTLRVSDAQQALQGSLALTTTDFEKQRQKVVALAGAAQTLALSQDLSRRRGPDTTQPENKPSVQRQEASIFAQGIQVDIEANKNLTPLLAHNLQLEEQFAEVYGRVPPTKTLNLIFNNKDAKLSLENLVREVQGLPPLTAAAAAAAGDAVSRNFNAAVLAGADEFGLGASISEKFALLPAQADAAAAAAGTALGGVFSSAFAAAANLEATIQADVTAGKQARQAFLAATDPLRQGIAGDKADLAQLGTDMADAVTQGAQQLSQAIDQAKQNLNTIGQDLAQSLQQFIEKPLNDEQAKISAAQTRLSLLGDKTTLQNLRGEVLLPGGKSLSQDPTKAIAQLEALEKTSRSPALQQFIQQYQAASLQEKSDQLATRQAVAQAVEQRSSTQLANLTDLFNTGKISQATLEKDVTALLRKQGLTPKTARSRGAAFADTLAAQLQGLDQQAAAIKGGPQQQGSGLIPSITRPIDTLNATQKSIASIAKQQRDKQLDESKKQTGLLNKIHGMQAANKAVGSLDHNPGTKTKRGVDLVGTGG